MKSLLVTILFAACVANVAAFTYSLGFPSMQAIVSYYMIFHQITISFVYLTKVPKPKGSLTPKHELEAELDIEPEIEPKPKNVMTDDELIKFRHALTKVKRMTYNLSLLCG